MVHAKLIVRAVGAMKGWVYRPRLPAPGRVCRRRAGGALYNERTQLLTSEHSVVRLWGGVDNLYVSSPQLDVASDLVDRAGPQC